MSSTCCKAQLWSVVRMPTLLCHPFPGPPSTCIWMAVRVSSFPPPPPQPLPGLTTVHLHPPLFLPVKMHSIDQAKKLDLNVNCSSFIFLQIWVIYKSFQFYFLKIYLISLAPFSIHITFVLAHLSLLAHFCLITLISTASFQQICLTWTSSHLAHRPQPSQEGCYESLCQKFKAIRLQNREDRLFKWWKSYLRWLQAPWTPSA